MSGPGRGAATPTIPPIVAADGPLGARRLARGVARGGFFSFHNPVVGASIRA